MAKRARSPSDQEYHETQQFPFYNTTPSPSIQCTLPPNCSIRPQTFDSTAAFERHYSTEHALSCSACHRMFPSSYLLELHFSELHDPFLQVKKSRGEKIYRCFVEGCEKICSEPKKRRLHLIDKHAYPKEYMFNVVQWGIGRNQTSLLFPSR
ncbi:hypothetical protein V1514DRAFT_324570 [Lipomyces japonicus]|uniref:uncharacterized protein n=1 Tax=Lipomyces japonicus TaxID=56871 RepID=UPI0034CFC802